MIKKQMYAVIAAVCIGISLVFQGNISCLALENNQDTAAYYISSKLTQKEKEIISILSKIENDDYDKSTLNLLKEQVEDLNLTNSNNIRIASYIIKTLSSKIPLNSADYILSNDIQSNLIDYLIKQQKYDGSWKSFSFDNSKGVDETKLVLNSLVSYMDANKNEEGIILTNKSEELKNTLDTSLKYLALESLVNMNEIDSHDLTLKESPTIQSSPYYTGSIDNNSTVINMGSAFNNSSNSNTLPTNINNSVTIDNSVTTNYINKNNDEIEDSDLTSIRKNIKNIKNSLDDFDDVTEKINNYNTTNNTEGDTYNTTNNNETINEESNLADLKDFLSQLLGGQRDKYSNISEDGSPDYSSDVENILELDGDKDEEGNVDLSQLATKEDLNKLAKYIHDTNISKQQESNKMPKEIVIAFTALGAGWILKKLAIRLGGN